MIAEGTPSNTVKLDVIWVVDNSGSMWDYHEALLNTLDGFLYQLVGKAKRTLDIRMGLLSTDRADETHAGFLPHRIVDQSNPEAWTIFKEGIERLGNHGDASSEQAFFPIEMNLARFPNFLRKNSRLILIVISDEPEQGREALAVGQFLSFLYSQINYRFVSAYGLFGMKEVCGSYHDDFAGSDYQVMVRATGGKAFPICNSFEESFYKMAEAIVKRFRL